MGIFFLLFLLFIILFAIWSIGIEPRLIRISRHQTVVRKYLPQPLRILHLSDTHFAKSDRTLCRFFHRLSRESVDLVFITGDIMDCEEGLPACLENLRKLKPRFGTFAIFGNHDYFDFQFSDVFLHNFPGQARPLISQRVEVFKRALEEAGIRVLMNETESVTVDGTSLLIHGLDDPTTGHADLLKAMQNFDPGKINILLSHTIDVFLDLGEGQIDLAFSGHSHGGQIRLPLIGPIVTHTSLGRPYAAGIFDLKGAVCTVSRGMNASRFLTARFLCSPEAILL
ncbi:MAG TPA: metallophosphoesterase, partial [bacterium]|nr:metallophosphoesterase [bacterium]